MLLSILEKETILARIKVLDDGRFTLETKDWDSYWHTLHELEHGKVEQCLDALHHAWRDYLRSGYSSYLRREFCFRYFSLLDILLSVCTESNAAQSRLCALQTVLGFECFGIVSATDESEILGAGICTIRNPCYLLAKLKMPDVLDDPQFLPVITVADTQKPELFYHYRQYSLSLDSPISLMFYLAVSEEKRSASFSLINSLAGGVSYGIDPRTRERAKRLFQNIIRSIVEADQLTDSGTLWLEFVDVGAGSGGLTSTICRQILDMGFKSKFWLWFVDLEPADPTRFFRDKKLRGIIDSLLFLGDDYRSWLSREQPLPVANGLRIALVSRLFNNLSHFSIRHLSKQELLPFLGKPAASLDSEEYLPSVCLAHGNTGAESLLISNTRLALEDGRTFIQPSLSEFYGGLYLLSIPNSSVATPKEGVFLPVRSFNSECLITLDGKSIISCLAENCDYVIIEDADLRSQDLIDHLEMFSLKSIIIQDLTEVLGLTGNHAYVISSKNEAREEPNFGGERIW